MQSIHLSVYISIYQKEWLFLDVMNLFIRLFVSSSVQIGAIAYIAVLFYIILQVYQSSFIAHEIFFAFTSSDQVNDGNKLNNN